MSATHLCSYCGAAAGYMASCREAQVKICIRHVGSACARWLYDMDLNTVEVRRIRRPWVIAFAVQEGFPTSDFKAGYEAAIADMTAAQAAAAREDHDDGRCSCPCWRVWGPLADRVGDLERAIRAATRGYPYTDLEDANNAVAALRDELRRHPCA